MPHPTVPRRWIRSAAVVGVAAIGLTVCAALPANALTNPFGSAPTDPPGTFAQQNLAVPGQGGFPYYRIPALADLGGGTVLAAYDGRPGSGGDAPNPNSIVMRASSDNGATWGAQSTIQQGQTTAPTTSYSDPSFLVDNSAAALASNGGRPLVFNFHTYGKDQGYAGSAYGSNDADRNVLSINVSESKDEGATWTSRTVTPEIKQANWAGTFMTSGEGIQLKYGQHAGRLIEMALARVGAYAGDPNPKAEVVSVYSDDHGATWHAGTPAGTGMDESKVVELSNGDLMLNSRASDGTKYRKTAISTDGGVTWGPISVDKNLPDPNVNASITRLYPNAPEGSAKAKMLLFSNADSQTSRSNGAVRLSCDDGATWPGYRVFDSGAMGYSTLTPLDDGSIGLLYENGSNITFAKFSTSWLDAVCAPLSAAPVSVANGKTADVAVTVANQQSTPLTGGSLTINSPIGWSAGTVAVPTIAAGGTATVSVPLTAADSAKAGAVSMNAVLTTPAGQSQGQLTATVTGGATGTVYGVDVYGQATDSGRNLASDPYQVGDQVPYEFKVYNAGNAPEAVVPTQGNFDPFAATPVGQSAPAGNCRWGNASTFQPGGSYLCTTPKHTVTAAELADGFFTPQTTWTSGATAQAGDPTLVTQSFTGAPVDLVARKPALSATGTRTVSSGEFAQVGDTVSTAFTVTNSGNVRLTGISADGVTCTDTTLLAGATTDCSASGTLTEADLKAGSLPASEVQFSAQNGTLPAQATATLAATELHVATTQPGNGNGNGQGGTPGTTTPGTTTPGTTTPGTTTPTPAPTVVSASGTNLASTGSDVVGTAWFAAALAALGLGAVAAAGLARRRSARP